MVYKYKRTTNRGTWTEDAMAAALAAVRTHQLSYDKAAKEYNIPKSTLMRRAKNVNKEAKETSKVSCRCAMQRALFTKFLFIETFS